MRLANFFKYKFILLYSALILLLWLSIIGGIILLKARPEKTIIMQYLDYECNPIADQIFIIKDNRAGLIPFAAGKEHSTEVITDENGYAILKRRNNSLFKIINKKNWDGPLHGNTNSLYYRNLTEDITRWGHEVSEAITSTHENPLIVYPYHIHPINKLREFNKKEVEFSKNDFKRNNKIEYMLSGKGGSPQTIAKLIISQKGESYVIDVLGQRDGGLIENENKHLTLNTTLPIEGYESQYRFIVSEEVIFPAQKQNIFYFKYINGYGYLALSFTIIHESLVMNSFIDSFVIKEKTDSAPIKLPVSLPQESCGGVAARHYDGYYGKISDSSRLIKSIEKKYSYKSKDTSNSERESADRKSLENKAKDINTEDSWFVEIGPNSNAAFLAINNNAPIQSRLETLFHINHNREPNPPIELTHRIARDIRTPPHVLREIYDLNITDRINWEVMLNPNTPTDVADNILNELTHKILDFPEYEREIMYFFDRVFSPYHNNSISSKSLNNSVMSIADRFAQAIPWGFYQDKRVYPQTINAIWEAQKEHNKGKKYRFFLKSPLVENKNTPLPVLMDIYQHLENNMGYTNNLQLIKLLDNSAIPRRMFHDLYNNKFASKDRFYILACSKRTPSEILSELASDNYFDDVRRCVAKNPGASRDTLLSLPKKYLSSVARNPSLQKDDFLNLFGGLEDLDIIERYSYSLMRSTMTPAHVIQVIYENNWMPSDSSYFIDNINTPISVLNSMYGKENRLDVKIAGHPNISEKLAIDILDGAKMYSTTLALADNPATPASILWRLFNKDFVVIDGIVEFHTLSYKLYCNPSTPKEIKYQLPYMADQRCKGR